MTKELLTVEDAVDATRYPLREEQSPAWLRSVARARQELAQDGCSILRGFIRPERLAMLREECASVTGFAYDTTSTVNVYNTSPDPSLPKDHPAHIRMERGNSFVARIDIPADFIIHRLYLDMHFQAFLTACLSVPRIHPLGDPFAGLCLNVIEPGRAHPWHFDTNEYAVSLVTQAPSSGGDFEYCPEIRSPHTENLPEVASVLHGDSPHMVRRRTLRPGDLQLFRGRHALHRVTQVQGRTARHSVIFSYSETAGVVGSRERTRQLFGRTTAAHAAPRRPDDGLLD